MKSVSRSVLRLFATAAVATVVPLGSAGNAHALPINEIVDRSYGTAHITLHADCTITASVTDAKPSGEYYLSGLRQPAIPIDHEENGILYTARPMAFSQPSGNQNLSFYVSYGSSAMTMMTVTAVNVGPCNPRR